MKQEKYKEFRGTIPKEISKLIAENRTIMSVDKLMQLRLDCRDAGYYTGNDYVTGDAIIYHPNGKIKIILDSEHINELKANEEYPYWGLGWKGLVLDEKVYESLQGSELSRKDLEKYFKLDIIEAKSNPLWKFLAQENQSLLNNYVDYVFSKGLEVDTSHWLFGNKKTKENYKAMGINLLDEYDISEVGHPILRACEIRNFGLGSDFVGHNPLWGSGTLIGISKDENEDKEEREKPEVLDDIDLSPNLEHVRRFNNLFSRKTPALSYSYN